MNKKTKYANIEIEKIIPNRKYQFRDNNVKNITGLAESIKNDGVLQPICVTQCKSKYRIIYGHRRYYAAKKSGLKNIPCKIVENIEDIDIAKYAIIENEHRQDLNPVEEANMYQQMLSEFNLTQEGLASIVGKRRSVIAHTISLLKLPKEIQANVSRDIKSEKDVITVRHARALLKLDNKDIQLTIFREILLNGYSVRQTENLIDHIIELKKKHPKPREKETGEDYCWNVHKLNTSSTNIYCVFYRQRNLISQVNSVIISNCCISYITHLISQISYYFHQGINQEIPDLQSKPVNLKNEIKCKKILGGILKRSCLKALLIREDSTHVIYDWVHYYREESQELLNTA